MDGNIFETADGMRFLAAARLTSKGSYFQDGIGSLGEKQLHATIKNYFDPEAESQEIRVGKYVADIVREEGIVEIQTGNFSHLNAKLDAFLPVTDVTVVYPAPLKKSLYWVNPETGEMEGPNRSNKKDNGLSIFYQMVYIKKHHLQNSNLHFCILQVELDEIKCRNGYGKRKTYKAEWIDHVPKNLLGQVYFESIKDMVRLFPSTLPAEFDVKQLAKEAKISDVLAQRVCKVLFDQGGLEREKQGRKFVYHIATE